MDTYVKLDTSFYCKRHAKDHQSTAHHNAPGLIEEKVCFVCFFKIIYKNIFKKNGFVVVGNG